MAISGEIRNYFSDLIKPLATNQPWKEMFSKLKEKIVSKFKEKLEQQRLTNLKRSWRGRQIINELERHIALQKNM